MPPTDDIDLILRVNAAGQPMGSIRKRALRGRTDVHYQTAHIFIFTRALLLLQVLGEQQGAHAQQLGSSVAAYVRPGDTAREAAQRRAREELGLDLRLDRVGETTMTDVGGTKHVALFAAASPTKQLHLREPQHVASVIWLPMRDVARAVIESPTRFTPTFLLLFQTFYPDGRARRTA